MKPVPFLLGRLIYGGFFLYSGINHFRQSRKLAHYTASKNVPFPEVVVAASGAMLTLAGMSILLGFKPKAGILATAAFLGGASPIMHDFWRHTDPEQRQNDMINFTKNMALLGAGLALMGVEEPWPVSVPAEKPSLLERAADAARRLAA